MVSFVWQTLTIANDWRWWRKSRCCPFFWQLMNTWTKVTLWKKEFGNKNIENIYKTAPFSHVRSCSWIVFFSFQRLFLGKCDAPTCLLLSYFCLRVFLILFWLLCCHCFFLIITATIKSYEFMKELKSASSSMLSRMCNAYYRLENLGWEWLYMWLVSTINAFFSLFPLSLLILSLPLLLLSLSLLLLSLPLLLFSLPLLLFSLPLLLFSKKGLS